MTLSVGLIRDRIATALAGEIGSKTYATATGEATVTALTVDYGTYQEVGGKLWPQKPKRNSGLEVVIEPEIDSLWTPLLGGDYDLKHNTRVVLKQWDPADTTISARSAFIREFGNAITTVGPRQPRVSSLGSIEQIQFTFVLQATS